MNSQIFSCPCLYDQCLVSAYLKENLEEFELRIQKNIEDLMPCLVRFKVSAEIMKIFITFNSEMVNPLKDLLKTINLEPEKEFILEGWDKFYIRQNKDIPFNYGSEWECISLNLYRLNSVFSE